MIARGFKLLLVLAVLAQTSTAVPKEDEIKWGTNIACTWIIFTIIQTYEQICRPTSNDGFQIFLKEALPQLRDAVTRKGLLTKEQIEEFQSGLLEDGTKMPERLCDPDGDASGMATTLRANHTELLSRSLDAHIEEAPTERVIMCYHSRDRSRSGRQ